MDVRRQWLPDDALLMLRAQGLSLEEIAGVIKDAYDWRPTVSAVSKRLSRAGVWPTYASHRDMIPWRIRPVHNRSPLRRFLQAESRRRQGLPLKRHHKDALKLGNDLIHGPIPLVVSYDERYGFITLVRLPGEDIIRRDPAQPDKSVASEPDDLGVKPGDPADPVPK